MSINLSLQLFKQKSGIWIVYDINTDVNGLFGLYADNCKTIKQQYCSLGDTNFNRQFYLTVGNNQKSNPLYSHALLQS